MEASDLKAITVARKPLIGTVAANVLQHGCGGLNIAASRIAGIDPANAKRIGRDYTTEDTYFGDKVGQKTHAVVGGSLKGRWPANLILSHLDGCRCVGAKKVAKGGGNGAASRDMEHREGFLSGEETGGFKQSHYGADGKETVANWICVEGCPVAALDGQSGTLRARGNLGSSKGGGGMFGHGLIDNDFGGGDTGGASRFFKQVGAGEKLTDYLRLLITPPDGDVRVVSLDWGHPVPSGLHGIIAYGTPSTDQAQELHDALLPGGHLLLIAPEDEPTGHTGTCRIEDAGFEIRDSILLILGAGGFWYVPKPSRAERDAGCGHLSKTGAEAVGRVEGSPGTKSPAAGAGRMTSTVGNHHPTVKPSALMAKLIEGCAAPVLDPFMGSGSTGIGAVLTGHDFIGIEKEAEYMEVADARIRHWADSEWRGHIIEVSSDHEAEGGEAPELDMADLFGFGGGE